MKVSSASIILKEKDILELLDEYLHVEGLRIDSVFLDEVIIVKGRYEKKLSISFEARIGIGNVHGNVVNLKVYKLKIYKFGIFNIIKNKVVKNKLKNFEKFGVNVDGDTVNVELDKLKTIVPKFDFNVTGIEASEGKVQINVENIIYNKDKESPHFDDDEKKYPSFMLEWYEKFRKKTEAKMPDKYAKVAEYILIIPDIVVLFWKLFRDKRVSAKIKILIVNAMIYIISPIDLIPGFIPVLGQMDDAAVAFIALNMVIDKIPEEVLLDNWSGSSDIFIIAKNAVKYMSEIVGAGNFSKISSILRKKV